MRLPKIRFLRPAVTQSMNTYDFVISGILHAYFAFKELNVIFNWWKNNEMLLKGN